MFDSLSIRQSARRAALLSFFACATALPMATANAQSTTLNRFNPAALPTDGFATSTADTLGHLRYAVQVYFDYAHDPLVFETNFGDRDSEIRSVVEHQLVGHVAGALGIGDRTVVFAQLPITMYMNGEGVDGLTPTPPAHDDPGIGDFSVGARVRIFGEPGDTVNIAGQLRLAFPLARAAQGGSNYLGERSLLIAPSLIGAFDFDVLRFNVNLGAHIRKNQRFANARVQDDLTYSFGVIAPLNDDGLELVADAHGAIAFRNFFGRAQSTLEVLAGVKQHLDNGLHFGVGIGPGLTRGFGSPDVRALLTVAYSPEDEPPADPVDSDGDGLMDGEDGCPAEPEDADGFEDTDGCPDPDNDGDGVPDVDDAAPMEPEDADGFEDGDGAPDPDNDGDGILDVDDAAPNDAEDADGFEDEDGAPDPDNDADGVLDAADHCPTEPGVESNNGCPAPDRDGDGIPDIHDNCPDEPGTVEFHGCAEEQRVVIEDGRLEILERVHFRTNRATILRDSYPLLDNVAEVLERHPEITLVRVEGHTDARGRRSYNLRLSQRRAEAVVTYLIRRGVDRRRLEARGFGPDRPRVADATTDEHHEENRRVEFIVVDSDVVAGTDDAR